MPSNSSVENPLAIEPPSVGRVYRHRRRVQLADGSPKGRMRLDAMARYLQDVSDEDTTEAGFDPSEPWVVRRVQLAVEQFPSFREHVEVMTWCSGIGGRWAERRVRLRGDSGGAFDAAVLWVHLDRAGRPARISEAFLESYGEAANGRKVRARLQHDSPPADGELLPFPLRFTDFDLMGHVNNAVSWIPLETALGARPRLRAPLAVSVEHPRPIDPGDEPVVRLAPDSGGDGAGFDCWIEVGGVVATSAQVRSGLATGGGA